MFNSQSIYDLGGRKVVPHEGERGLYIVGGKKKVAP